MENAGRGWKEKRVDTCELMTARLSDTTSSHSRLDTPAMTARGPCHALRGVSWRRRKRRRGDRRRTSKKKKKTENLKKKEEMKKKQNKYEEEEL